MIAFKGRHDISGSSVTFHANPGKLSSFNLGDAKTKIAERINDLIAKDLLLTQGTTQAGKRWVKFGPHQSLECGGTHVSSTKIIGEVEIRYVRKEKDSSGGKNDIQIGYNIKG